MWIKQHTNHLGELFYVHFNHQQKDSKSFNKSPNQIALDKFLIQLNKESSQTLRPEIGLLCIYKQSSANFSIGHSIIYSNLKCGSQNNQLLVQLQGTYLTLQSLMEDTFNELVHLISIKIADQVYRLHLFDRGSTLLIIVLPEHLSSNFCPSSFAHWFCRQLNFILGDIDYSTTEHHSMLDYCLELALRHLCATSPTALKQKPWLCQRFLLNRSLQFQVSKQLRQFSSLLHKTTNNHYQVIGSMMFYQNLLLESELEKEYTNQIGQYLKFRHFLSIDNQVEFVSWNKIHLHIHKPASSGETFFLLVVCQHSLLFTCFFRCLETNNFPMLNQKLLYASLEWIVNQTKTSDLMNQLLFELEIQKHCYSMGLCSRGFELNQCNVLQSSVWSRLVQQNQFERSSMDRVMAFVKQHLFQGLVYFLHLNTKTGTFVRPFLLPETSTMIDLANTLTTHCIQMLPKLEHTDNNEYLETFKFDKINQSEKIILYGCLLTESSKSYFLCFNAKQKLPKFSTCVDVLRRQLMSFDF